MELQNYNQDIISTSGSEIPPNYSDQNNPSFPQKQYSDGHSQVQQQYNLPQQPYYQPRIMHTLLILKINMLCPFFLKI